MEPRADSRADELREYASCDVDAVDERGMTALHRAAQQGSQARVEQLLEAGANVAARTPFHRHTPLHLAAAAGHAGLLHLLTTPSTLNQTDATHLTALQLAVKHHNWDAAAVLVAAGASPRAAAGDPLPLWWATKMLPDAGAAHTAALLVGAMKQDPSCAALLARTVRHRNIAGQTALLCAAHHGCQELVAKLVEAGADKDAVDRDGYSPLATAAAAGHVQLVPLLATPSNINRPVARRSWTALHRAAAVGDVCVVEALLAAGAAMDIPDDSGCSALNIAVMYQQTGAAALLLSALAKGWSNKDSKARGVALLAAAGVDPINRKLSAPRCARLLGVVLDVLGPGVAAEVCQAVQQQLEEDWEQRLKSLCGTKPRFGLNHLAEALLLGWMETEERLHAARQPLVARLQRLVPGSGTWSLRFSEPQQQHQQQEHQQTEVTTQQRQVEQHQHVVAAAELAAGAGQQQCALELLQQLAALHLQQQPCRPGTRWALFKAGLTTATYTRVGKLPAGTKPADAAAVWEHASCFRPPAVYTTFLAAWVRAWRQLRQMPQEMAGVMVAAVEAALQHKAPSGLRSGRLQRAQQLARGQGCRITAVRMCRAALLTAACALAATTLPWARRRWGGSKGKASGKSSG